MAKVKLPEKFKLQLKPQKLSEFQGVLFENGQPVPADSIFGEDVFDLKRSAAEFDFLRGSTAPQKKKPKLVKHPKTGELGNWITLKGGRRVFISARKLQQNLEKNQAWQGIKDFLTALGIVAGALTIYYGSIGLTYYSIAKLIKAGSVQVLRIAQWASKFDKQFLDVWKKYPFKHAAEAGYYVQRESMNFVDMMIGRRGGIAAKWGIYGKTGFRKYGDVTIITRPWRYSDFGGKTLEVGYRLRGGPKKGFIKGFKSTFRDVYAMANELKATRLRMRANGDIGPAMAAVGFDFAGAEDMHLVQAAARDWLKKPYILRKSFVKKARDTFKAKDYNWLYNVSYKKDYITIPKQDLETLRRQIERAKTARDLATIKYYSQELETTVMVGKHFMTGVEWNGVVRIDTANRGHAYLYRWMYGPRPPRGGGVKTTRPALPERGSKPHLSKKQQENLGKSMAEALNNMNVRKKKYS